MRLSLTITLVDFWMIWFNAPRCHYRQDHAMIVWRVKFDNIMLTVASMDRTNLVATMLVGLRLFTCLVQLPPLVDNLQQLLELMFNLHGRPKSPTRSDSFQPCTHAHLGVV